MRSGTSLCNRHSLSSPGGGEGRGEEVASLGDARTPPSPTLPPLVPRGERERFVEYAKHILAHRRGPFWLRLCRSVSFAPVHGPFSSVTSVRSCSTSSVYAAGSEPETS